VCSVLGVLLHCVVCIVCVQMCTVLLPSCVNPISVNKYILNKEYIVEVYKLMCEDPDRDLVHITGLNKPTALSNMMQVIW
jgi:hypothetical protein